MLLLSMKFATVDQSILQRAFGAKSPRVAAKGMVLAGIVTTPIALFCILPGIAMAKLQPVALYPALAVGDAAIPTLLKTYLPMAGHGLLGIVLCGLVASQVDTITSDVNSVATLFTNDVYRNLKRKPPTQRQLLFVVRLSSALCAGLMLAMAWFLQYTGTGAVELNMTVVGILDMPLFVIVIVYGIYWRRTNWQGATAGFIAGGLVGVGTYLLLDPQFNGFVSRLLHADFLADWNRQLAYYSTWRRSFAPILSTLTALVVTPIVSLLTRPNVNPEMDRLRELMFMRPALVGGAAGTADEVDARAAIADGMRDDGDDFTLIPQSSVGRIALVATLASFGAFVFGILSASWSSALAPPCALAGLAGVLMFGLVRAYVR